MLMMLIASVGIIETHLGELLKVHGFEGPCPIFGGAIFRFLGFRNDINVESYISSMGNCVTVFDRFAGERRRGMASLL